MATTTTPTQASGPTIAAHPYQAVTSHSIRERLPLAILVGTLMLGMGLLVGGLWPSLKGTFADLEAQLPEIFTALLGGVGLGTPVGWANAELVALVAPIGAIAVALIATTQGIAGEEETKTLGVLLSAPISRTTFILAKATAMVFLVAIVGVASYLGLLIGSAVGDMGLSQSGMIGASVHITAVGIFFGGVAILIGAISGKRRLTIGAAAGLAGLSFAAASFLPLSDSLANGAKASPWYYFNNAIPLANGIEWTHVLILIGGGALLVVTTLPIFKRRDLRG
ncbi:ABC transporter permease subunit [Ornithinimicrobium sp. Arc0846-15]|nr:ABC transporter permease subunit [Ornithinimicrobium laminariae]